MTTTMRKWQARDAETEEPVSPLCWVQAHAEELANRYQRQKKRAAVVVRVEERVHDHPEPST